MNLTSRAGRRVAVGIALACSATCPRQLPWRHRQPPARQAIPARLCCQWPAPLPVLPPSPSGASSR
jgi:hypothetical protein